MIKQPGDIVLVPLETICYIIPHQWGWCPDLPEWSQSGRTGKGSATGSDFSGILLSLRMWSRAWGLRDQIDVKNFRLVLMMIGEHLDYLMDLWDWFLVIIMVLINDSVSTISLMCFSIPIFPLVTCSALSTIPRSAKQKSKEKARSRFRWVFKLL